MKLINIPLIIALLVILSCTPNQQRKASSIPQPSNPKQELSHLDTIPMIETFQKEDTAFEKYLAERLKPIRANFKRINAVAKWTSIAKKDITESTEGGEATFYYLKGVLEKIEARHFGEAFQQLTEYYLLNEQLSFAYETSYKYNRPIFYDSANMKENNDNQVFDFNKSEIGEYRYYFDNEKLIHKTKNKPSDQQFSGDELVSEQKRIKTEFNKLQMIGKSK